MTKKENALALFREGFSCSQALVAAYAEDFGLAKELALRISQPFGGGVARTGDWCGAVTGALMVIGLKYGRFRVEDGAARDKTYALVKDFLRMFTDRHGSVRCRDLLGCDIATPEGQKVIEDLNLHKTRCEVFVGDAADILDAIL